MLSDQSRAGLCEPRKPSQCYRSARTAAEQNSLSLLFPRLDQRHVEKVAEKRQLATVKLSVAFEAFQILHGAFEENLSCCRHAGMMKRRPRSRQ